MNTNLREFKLFESGTQSYVKYNEGDVVTFRNSLWIGGPRIKVGRIPTESGSGWTRSLSGDITGVAVTADAGLTGTMWTRDGFHYQDITIATGGITTAHIADNAITSSKIADGAILGVDVAVGVTLTNPDITGDAEVFGNVYITGTAASVLNTAQTNNPVLKISGTNRFIAIDCGVGGVSVGGGGKQSTSTFNYAEFANQLSVAGGGISAQSVLIEGYTGEFVDIISVKGLSAQSGVVDGYTGNFNNIVAHGGISASGISLGVLSSNYLGLIASVNAISAGSLWVDIQQAGAINLNNELGFGVSAEGNYIRGYTGTFKNVELVQGLSAQDGLIEGYTGEFNQVVAISGISSGGTANFGGNIVLENNDVISNPSAYTVRIMPEGTSATDYGLEFEFSDWGYGSVITSRRASDGANAGSIRFDSAVVINNDKDLTMGGNAHSRMRFSTTGNNTLQIGVSNQDADNCSGALALINAGHLGQSYRSPVTEHVNPNLYVYSYNTGATKYIRFEHDGTDANIVTGAGDISLQPASGVVEIIAGITASGGVTFAGNVTASTFVGALTGNVTGNASGSAATVTTAAQGNITSVGTLTALTMGGELSCVDNLVTRPELKDIAETVNAIGTITGDTAVSFADGNVQTVTGNGDCLFTFTNPPATGKAGTLTMIITNGGANTTTWHSSVKWPGNNAPALTSSGVDIVSFMTIDAGTTIYGFVGGINFS